MVEENKEKSFGVKLSNTNSQFNVPKKKEEPIQKNVLTEKEVEQNQKAVELVKQYWNVFKSSALENNKGPIEKGIEKELLLSLQEYILDLNNDSSKPEGFGSSAALSLLFKSMFLMRDRNNELAFKIQQLEKEVEKLKLSSEKIIEVK